MMDQQNLVHELADLLVGVWQGHFDERYPMARKKRSSRKQKSSKPRRSTKKQPSSPGDELPQMPSRTIMEQAMGRIFGLGGRHRSSPAHEAQQLAYGAMEAAESGDVDRAIDLAQQAVELDRDCVDALILLSQVASETQAELIANIQRTVEAGERALGEQFFKENAGYFWGILETRPYMRARAFLVQCLVEAGRRDEAIAHYESMLTLNPNDNQGLRYRLMGLYLETGRLDGAAALFGQFEDEGSAMFTWARVLERRLAGDEPGASEALQEARQVNRHVEPLLTGRKRMPRQMPDYYGMGDENEAVVCVSTIGTAWKRAGEALTWLKGRR